MRKFLVLFSAVVLLASCGKQEPKDPVDYVDPFIGTGGHGHTYPGASMPFGMVQLSPDTRLTGWDGCSGYHYSDDVIYGFSHTHLSGTGVGDYCDILLMPFTGEASLNNGYPDDYENGYGSRFSKKHERASAGFYQVTLDRYDVEVSLTATPRTGLHRYVFSSNKQPRILLDLTHRDKVLASSVEKISEYEIIGMRRSEKWANDQHVYFVARFSQPMQDFHLAVDDKFSDKLLAADGKNLKAVMDFAKGTDTVLVQVGISAVSIEGARKNLEAEWQNWDFEGSKAQARYVWNEHLKRVEVSGNDTPEKITFYTALYHSLLNPNLFSDVDGNYRGTDLKTHHMDGRLQYTVFSLWDTYRATHPLFTILERQRSKDFIRSMLNHYRQGGQLPMWELAANYTGCMIGYHAVPVIADAYVKGIRGFDAGLALEAMKHAATRDHLGLDAYKKYGFIPHDHEHESVSKTLEYAYDDWCIARMANKLGHEEDYKEYTLRAQNYKNLYDPDKDFIHARTGGIFREPFDPAEVNNHFTEANCWQYTFYVPQDVAGMMELYGGREKFVKKLDGLFNASSKTTGRQQSDITGLIGQYAHGNEPSHHIAYLYNYAGYPWKTQAMARRIMDKMYSHYPDGLAGNEDCGQMSSWYVLSAMGFYPVTPGSDLYAIGSPMFDTVRINLENGRTFSVIAKHNSSRNVYIQKAFMNGKEYNKSYLRHQDIMNGSTLVFEMGPKPNRNWGSGEGEIPVSEIRDHEMLPVPYIKNASPVFDSVINPEMAHIDPMTEIYYTFEKDLPEGVWVKYEDPPEIKGSTTLKLYARHPETGKSKTIKVPLHMRPQGISINLKSDYADQYAAGGDQALIDGIRGGEDYKLGRWQGYQGTNLKAIVELDEVTEIEEVGIGFLQDINAWIFMPESVRFAVSIDGEAFKKVGEVKNMVEPETRGAITKDFKLNLLPIKAKYIKVEAENIGQCPPWHKGAGNPAWIFADEIWVGE
ncbi:MAG: GH92 family glycosyl hydrolase [Bacteroidales bacterium]|nr:GH92 family glycosyl hydrolase [Bacteroidales bacterium]